jgi:hypothetical protein
MTNDFMLDLAHEYMDEMGIANTQYIVVRHHNTDHDHFHIVYNRIDNDLKLISVNNDYHRNVAACKKLKDRHGLTYGTGKEKVNRQKLTGAEKVKYQIHDEIAANLPKCADYADLEKRLRQAGITIQYKYRSGAEESSENIQGVSFAKGKMTFKGSQVDRKFSHANLSKAFNENMEAVIKEFFGGDVPSTQRHKWLEPEPRPQSRPQEPPKLSTEQSERAMQSPEPSKPSATQPEQATPPVTSLPEPQPQEPPKSLARQSEREILPVAPSPQPQKPPTTPQPRTPETVRQLDLFAPSQPLAQETPVQPEPPKRLIPEAPKQPEPSKPSGPRPEQATPTVTSSPESQSPEPTKQTDPDIVKSQIHEAITANLPGCIHYGNLEERLREAGVTVQYKYRSGAKQSLNNIQGVSFEKDGITFKGSEIDRKFSHANLSDTLKRNLHKWFKANVAPEAQPVKRLKLSAADVSEAPKQPEPPKQYPYSIRGGGITAEQWETLKSGGHTFIENMDHPDGGKFSSYVFLSDDKKGIFYSTENPDKSVKCGDYRMRLRDQMQVDSGLITKAKVQWREGIGFERPFVWKDPASGEIKHSFTDPRLSKKQTEMERQAVEDNRVTRSVASVTDRAPTVAPDAEETSREEDNTIRRSPSVNRTPPAVNRTIPTLKTPSKGPRLG